METLMKKLRLTSGLILLLIMVLNFLANTYAANGVEYAKPASIVNGKLDTAQGADRVLSSEQLKRELKDFASSLTEKDITEQNLFNKMALLSLRDDLAAISNNISQQSNTLKFLPYQLLVQIRLVLNIKDAGEPLDALSALNLIQQEFALLSDETFVQMSMALTWSVPDAKDYVLNVYKQLQNKTLVSRQEMISLVANTHLYHVLAAVMPMVNQVIEEEQQRRFIIQGDVLVKLKSGIELSTTIVRSRGQTAAHSTALQFTIYANEASHIKTAMHAAAHGYIGMVANSRGKRSSHNDIVPWEYDGEDSAQLINWISEQVWSDGRVVMYGGSYNGFTQWATAKHMPKALKAMAPYAAANLITGLPYENNIALTGNFEWPLFATNNKTLDNSVYSDWQRTEQIVNELYKSGRPIVDIDNIAKQPSPWLQKWLAHPEDDAYYQSMVPHQQEYQAINIPVLTITGYFDGGQISALNYLHEHYKYNAQAKHTLLIGPYNHLSAQHKPSSHHSNYALDPVALEKDTEEVVFAWFDHVLRGKPQPKLLQNKVNYQVMGANEWRFSNSLQALNQQTLSFYIQNTQGDAGQNYTLARTPSTHANDFIEQTVDMADRTEQRNLAPWPVIQGSIDKQGGIQIETAAMEQDMELTGSITGFFDIAINKKDVDIGFNYYEITASGEVFHLNNYRSRASYADDIGQRRLLLANEKRRVPIVNARFTSKLIKKGSKIVLVLNVNKNVEAQVNLGTGTPVNHEHVRDAAEALSLKWYLSSQINLPLKAYQSSAK
jgi:uncharacterized protein